MNKVNSTVKLDIDTLNFDDIQSQIETKLLYRRNPCKLIIDLRNLNLTFAVFRSTRKLKSFFDKNREKTDKIIHSSDILVKSRRALLIAKLFVQLARPSSETHIIIKAL